MRRYTFAGGDVRTPVIAGYVSPYRQLSADRPVHAVAIAPDSEVRDVVVRDTTSGREYVINDGLVFAFTEPLMNVEARALYPSTRPAKLIVAEKCSDVDVLTAVTREGVRVLTAITGEIAGVPFVHTHAFPLPCNRTWTSYLGEDAAGGKATIASTAADGAYDVGFAYCDEMGVVTGVDYTFTGVLTGDDAASPVSTDAHVVAVLIRMESLDASPFIYELTDVLYGTVEHVS